MRIAVMTASSPVRSALEEIVRASGHPLVPTAGEAELVLSDAQHPLALALNCPILTLVCGAAANDDEISCPIRPHQLMQRLMVRAHTQTVPLSGGWVLDSLARSLTHANQPPVTLTEKECSLLNALRTVQPEAINRITLLAQVWGVGGTVDTHTLETHIYRLRSKLDALAPPPCEIVTTNGSYALAPAETVIT